MASFPSHRRRRITVARRYCSDDRATRRPAVTFAFMEQAPGLRHQPAAFIVAHSLHPDARRMGNVPDGKARLAHDYPFHSLLKYGLSFTS